MTREVKMNYRLFFKGLLPWEVWLEEHPWEILQVVIGIILIVSLILL